MKKQTIETSLEKIERLIDKLKLGPKEKKLWKEMKLNWQKRKYLAVSVISAIPLSPADLIIIENKVNAYLNVPFTLKNIVDKNILGGLRIEIGSKIYDATLKEKLEASKPILKNTFKI